MDNSQALTAVIEHVSASDKPVNLAWNEVVLWQAGTLERFITTGLLSQDVNTQSLMCTGCEQQCFMPVYLSDDAQRAFIVCDDADQQDQVGRINIPLERLQQWQASTRHFAGVVAGLLELKAKPDYQKNSASYQLGMLKSKGGRRWVSLTVQPLAIVINRHETLLNELLYFEDDELVIDKPRINELLNSPPSDTAKVYTPDVSKREERKLATQAKHQDWHDAYLHLKETHPTKTNIWYSMQISKLSIAQGQDSETIRKNMIKTK